MKYVLFFIVHYESSFFCFLPPFSSLLFLLFSALLTYAYMDPTYIAIFLPCWLWVSESRTTWL